MVDSASAVLACARAVDVGRRTAKGRRAGCPSPFAGWRSGAAERVQASVGIVESAIYAGVLAFPGLEVLGEVQQADLLELGRAVERRAVLDLGVVGPDRVEDRVALLLGAPVGHGEDRVVPVGVGRALI